MYAWIVERLSVQRETLSTTAGFTLEISLISVKLVKKVLLLVLDSDSTLSVMQHVEYRLQKEHTVSKTESRFY